MKKILKQMSSLQASIEEEIGERELKYLDMSEKWQDSEKGDVFQEKTDRMQEMLDELIDWQQELG